MLMPIHPRLGIREVYQQRSLLTAVTGTARQHRRDWRLTAGDSVLARNNEALLAVGLST